MNRFRQRNLEASRRMEERRRRESLAPRLMEIAPSLRALHLEIQEHRSGFPIPESAHIRRINVAHAPALFEIPCMDSYCADGGHELTQVVLDGLRGGKVRFEGVSRCRGRSGSADCGRELHYVVVAEYGQ